MIRSKIIFFFILISACGFAQSYDNDLLSSQFHKGRREAIRNGLPDSSCAVFFSNPEQQRAGDTKFLYHQDPDFYYLSGLNEPNSLLIIFKEPQTFYDTITTNELIFVQDRNPSQESWTGKLLGKEGVKQQLGFKYVFLNNQFADFKIDFEKFYKVYHLDYFDAAHDDLNDRGDLASLIRHFKLKTDYKRKNVDGFNLSGLMASLREVKQPEELVLMRKAIDISCLAHAELMRALIPGMAEYQAQAIAEYIFKKEGSEYVAYPSIVGAGENSCILHYETNRKKMDGGDLMVIDAGAEYHGYAADITRTLPVNGVFSPEEKAIYEIVLEAQEAGIKACRAGAEFRATHKAAVAVVQKRLLELGIIKDPNDFMLYFFHGTSHYLGLNVHDAGNYGKLSPGNIITVEPGIYIPAGSNCDPKWWNIGIRIEDDVLITTGDPDVLSGKLPKKIADIEALMKEESVFNKIK
ncbi:MAG: family metallopeptidase [Bacteroidetes bacterium]|nr:family metallopeptidase [Bacteroidota bacterium]